MEGWAKQVGPEVVVAASDREEMLSASVWMKASADQGQKYLPHCFELQLARS